MFAPNGRAAITYRVEVGVCLASGDPVGDPKAWPQAIDAWLRLCQEYGWAPGVMGASSAAAQAFREAGLNALQLGDEAILHPDGFRLSGPDMRAVRQAVTRARRAGLTVRIRRHRDISPDEMAEVVKRADAWRDTETERGFSMALGRLGDPADGDCLLVEAMQNHGRAVVAMLSLVPWGTNGVSLDLMRRSPQITQRHHRTDGDRAVPAVRRHWCQPHFAELRDVPFGVRAGCAARRRPGRPAVARAAGVLLPLVAAGDAVPLEHEVPTRVGAALRLLRGRPARSRGSAWRRSSPRASWCCRSRGETSSRTPGITSRRRRIWSRPGLLHHDGSAPDLSELAADLPENGDEPRLPEQVRVRMAKLKALQDSGVDAYPVGQAPSHTIAQAVDGPDDSGVTVAGRVLRVRDYGGVLFAQLRDWSGEAQLLLDNSRLDTGSTADFTGSIDLGDLIEVTGVMGQSRSGIRSLIVSSWRLIGKCLRPLPDKWKGLTDQEARVRARYVDLAINTEARELIRARSGVLHAIRETLVGKGFSGGRDADPAADPRRRQRAPVPHPHQRLRSRPLPAHRPRAVPQAAVRRRRRAGLRARPGVPQRGGGLQPQPRVHPAGGLPGARRLQRVDRRLPRADPERGDGRQRRTRVHASPRRRHAGNGGHLRPVAGQDRARRGVRGARRAHRPRHRPEHAAPAVRRGRYPYHTHWDAGAVVLEMYEHLVEDQTEAPTFYKDFPTSVSPLTRPHRSMPGVAERWDLVAWGVELGTAYSELTDPVEQRRRLQEQSLLASGGDPEAMELDEDFLQAMEYAMPPTGGLGMGVDRVVMLITGRSIRETLPFPLAKPR